MNPETYPWEQADEEDYNSSDSLEEQAINAFYSVPSYAERFQRDNAEWFQVGDYVRINRPGELHGQYGTIYAHVGGRPAPWHVRPDGWDADVPGVALKTCEMHLQ